MIFRFSRISRTASRLSRHAPRLNPWCRTPPLFRALAALLATLASSWAADNAENMDPLRLDPYQVNDPRFVRDRTRPAAVYKIEGGQLDAMNLANTEDALKYAPNVFVRKRFIGDQNGALTIRGTNTNQSARSLVLADGLVLSNFLGSGHGFSPRWGLVAPEEIERVEVVYGPYSALYPGNSLGGVVLFTTGFPSAFTATAKVSFFFNDYAEYATKDVFRGHQAAVSLGDRQGKFTYFVFFNRLQNDSNPTDFRSVLLSATTPASTGTLVTGAVADLDLRERPRFITGAFGLEEVTQNQVKVKLAYDLSDGFTLSGSMVYFQRDANAFTDTFLRDAAGNPVYSGAVNVDGRRFTLGAADFGFTRREEEDLLASLALRGKVLGGWDVAALASSFIVLGDTTRSSSQSGPPNAEAGPGLIFETGDDYGWSNFDLKAVRLFEPGDASKHGVTVGYHYDRYRLQTEQFNADNWRQGAKTTLRDGQAGQTVTQALFAQDAWQFDTRWSVTVGARYERWRASEGARTVDSAGVRRRTALPGREQDRVSPKLALAWRPVKDWTARLSLARTSRFPTVGELYQGITLADGTVTNNNPTLRAESSFSKDLTFERALPQGVLRASLFEEDTKDTLFTQTNTTTLVTNFQNIPKVLTRGAEMAFDQKGFLIAAVDLQAGLTYTDSEIRSNPAFPASEGKQFPRISHWRASLFATYHATAALSLTAGWRYASGQFSTLDNIDTRATYGGVSGYSLIDLRAAYTLSRGFTVALGVDNVTRYKYYQGHNLLQRTYFAEIKARF